MLRIEIKSKTLANVRDYKGKNYGEQVAALHTGGDFPLAFRLNVEQGKEHAPGFYELDPSVFSTDKFGNLVMNRVRVLPEGKK